MKKILLTIGIALFSISAFAAQLAGKVVLVTGSVDVVKGDAVMGKMAKKGVELALDDILRTKRKGYAEVDFVDGSNLKIFEKSRLIFNGLDRTVDGYNAEIQKGKVLFRIEKMHDVAGDFRIKTSNAVIGVKGTAVAVETGIGGTIVEVYTGGVQVVPGLPMFGGGAGAGAGGAGGGAGGAGAGGGAGGAGGGGVGGAVGGAGAGGGVLLGAGGGVFIGPGGGIVQYNFGGGQGGESRLFSGVGGAMGGAGSGGESGQSPEQQIFGALGGDESGGDEQGGEGGGQPDGLDDLGGLGGLDGLGTDGDGGNAGEPEDFGGDAAQIIDEMQQIAQDVNKTVQDTIPDVVEELGNINIHITIE